MKAGNDKTKTAKTHKQICCTVNTDADARPFCMPLDCSSTLCPALGCRYLCPSRLFNILGPNGGKKCRENDVFCSPSCVRMVAAAFVNHCCKAERRVSASPSRSPAPSTSATLISRSGRDLLLFLPTPKAKTFRDAPEPKTTEQFVDTKAAQDSVDKAAETQCIQ